MGPFPEKYGDVFISRIREIRKCLDEQLYLSALSLSLTLPDMCGKAEYPEYNDKSKERYIKWFDSFVHGYEKTQSPYSDDLPHLNGEVVFQLRCNLLHSGNPNIDKKNIKEADNQIDQFVIEHGGGLLGDTSAVSYSAGLKPASRHYYLNMDLLCIRLCNAAEKYYEENKDKFSFINYTFVHSNVNENVQYN